MTGFFISGRSLAGQFSEDPAEIRRRLKTGHGADLLDCYPAVFRQNSLGNRDRGAVLVLYRRYAGRHLELVMKIRAAEPALSRDLIYRQLPAAVFVDELYLSRLRAVKSCQAHRCRRRSL